MLTRTDALNQQTQYTSDLCGRLTQTAHGTLSGSTFTADPNQAVSYSYNASNGKLGAVTFALQDFQGPSLPMTYSYQYSAAGRVTSQSMSWTMPNYEDEGYSNPSGTLTAQYAWDNEGKMTSVGYPSGSGGGGWGSYFYAYDSMGRLNTLSIPETLEDGTIVGYEPVVSGASYNASNRLTSLSPGYGYPVTETIGYNVLNQVTSMSATTLGSPPWGGTLLNMTYAYPSATNNGRISGSSDGISGENATYGYDSLNRLISASASSGGGGGGPLWGEQYTYDGFGNLTAKTVTQAPAPAMSATYDVNNHQIGLTYDANGNQLWDAGHDMQYAWNVENRLASETSTSGPQTFFSYDPWGRRVMEDVNANPSAGYTNGSWNFYFYDIRGHKIGTLNWNYLNSIGVSTNTYFGNRLILVNGNPVTTDRLGSSRATYTTGVGYSLIRYYPYGEEQTTTSDGIEKFATYFRDMEGQDYARARYYNSGTARFWSPDPGGIRTANPLNPFTWNRYAYAGGAPVNRFDPQGRADCAPDGSEDGEGCNFDQDAEPEQSGEGGCQADTCITVSADADEVPTETATHEPSTIGANGMYFFSTTVTSLFLPGAAPSGNQAAGGNGANQIPTLLALPASGPPGRFLAPSQQFKPRPPLRITKPPRLRPVSTPEPVLDPDPMNDPNAPLAIIAMILNNIATTLDTVIMPPVINIQAVKKQALGSDPQWH